MRRTAWACLGSYDVVRVGGVGRRKSLYGTGALVEVGRERRVEATSRGIWVVAVASISTALVCVQGGREED